MPAEIYERRAKQKTVFLPKAIDSSPTSKEVVVLLGTARSPGGGGPGIAGRLVVFATLADAAILWVKVRSKPILVFVWPTRLDPWPANHVHPG